MKMMTDRKLKKDDWSSTWTSFPRTSSNVTLMTSKEVASTTPSVFVLESMNDGVVKMKVESDVMAYILYCHYSAFSAIQQRYSVAITWSSEGKSVLLCATQKHYDKESVVMATQEFLDLYHQLISQIVACKLNKHVKNITLHQFHRSSLEVRRLHPRVMIKEIRSSGHLALYGPYDDVCSARVTFINGLTSSREPRMNGDTKTRSLPRKSTRSISPQKRFLRQCREADDVTMYKQISERMSSSPVKGLDKSKVEIFEERKYSMTSSPTSQIKQYRTFESWKKIKILENLNKDHSSILSRRESLGDLREPRGVIRPQKTKSRPTSLEPVVPRSPLKKDQIQKSHLRQEKQSRFFTDFNNLSKPNLSTKEARIPDIKSPFNFVQNFKEAYSFTTPSDVTIQVLEGDVTHCDCDVIVHETDSNLKVGSELAWTIAKYGAFHINKQLKLYTSLHGGVPESKVVVTSSSVDLPSMYLLHAVTPEWREDDIRKSRKLLFNTYKNVFKIAAENFKAQSIALPVFAIDNPGFKKELFPLVAACDVMYQALIAVIKLGTSIKHLCYVSSNPKHVTAIVTSIRVKIENVNYEPRFLKQPQLKQQRKRLSSWKNSK